MADPKNPAQNPIKTEVTPKPVAAPVEAPKTAAEEMDEAAEMAKLEEEARIETMVAERVARVKAEMEAGLSSQIAAILAEQGIKTNPQQPTAKKIVQPKRDGDVKVRLLQDFPGTRCGDRVYDGKVGEQIWMSPSHANEYSTGVFAKNPYCVVV